MLVETLNLKEAAALLKMTSSSLRKKAKKGVLPGAKLGRDWIFIKQDIVEHLRLSYHSDVRRPLLNHEREALCQEKKNSSKGVISGGTDSPTLGLASKFEEVRARLKSPKLSKF
jgi:excisionase family DNA binding protein